jgi:hypothetical protein
LRRHALLRVRPAVSDRVLAAKSGESASGVTLIDVDGSPARPRTLELRPDTGPGVVCLRPFRRRYDEAHRSGRARFLHAELTAGASPFVPADVFGGGGIFFHCG